MAITDFKNKPLPAYAALISVMLVAVMTVTPAANAAQSWMFGATPQVLLEQYGDSQQRDALLGYGILLSADYLDKSGVKFGYNSQTVNGKAGFPDIEETTFFVSGHYLHFTDSLGGKLGLRLDGYSVDDQTKASTSSSTGMGKNQTTTTSSVSLTDKARVLYTQVDLTNFADTMYGDIGYALSHYDYENSDPTDSSALQDNNVSQVTATAGFALNNRYDWLQTRGYFIRLDHGDNTAGVTQTNAVELKWLHWFKPASFLHVHSSIVKLVAGKRLFAVDPDAQTAYSISDLQTGSVAAGLDWTVGEQGTFLLLVGYDRYENQAIADQYDARYVFSSLAFRW